MTRTLSQFFAAILACVTAFGLAAEAVDLAEVSSRTDVTPYWSVKPGDPENIDVPEGQSGFQLLQNHAGWPAAAEAYWFRIELFNSSSRPVSRLLELDNPLLAYVHMYVVDNGEVAHIEHAGFRIPAAEKSLQQPQPVLPISLSPGQHATVYLYAQSADRVRLSASLWSSAAFYQKQQWHTFIAAIGIGILLVMSLYNLGIWLITRDSTYRRLAAVSSSLLALILIRQGWAATYIWPDLPVLTKLSIGPALALALVSVLRFCQQFLHIPAGSRSAQLINVTCIINLLLGCTMVFAPSGKLVELMMLSNLPALLLPVIEALKIWQRNNSEGLHFLLATTPLLAAAILAMANRIIDLQLTPSTILNSVIVAAALLSVNLALLLAVRIRRVNADRDRAYQGLMLARDQARQSESKAQEATRDNDAKSAFLATMSHEIRTPMNGILGMADLLEHTELDNQQAYYLATLTRSGRALMDILNDVLDYSKVESGRLLLERIDTDLIQLVDDVVVLQRETLQRKGLECQVFLHPEVPQWLITDPTRLKQVLNNLLGNAVKFTESGEVSIRIKLLDEGHLSFSVCDEGIGMDKASQQKLFHRFEQADSSISRRYGGTGLGLAISRHLVTLFGGQIKVSSQPGEGSTFSFDIRYEASSYPTSKPDIAAVCMITTDECWIEAMTLLAARWQVDFSILEPQQPDYAERLAGLHANDVLLCDADPGLSTAATVIVGDDGSMNKPIAINELINTINAHASQAPYHRELGEQPLDNMDVLVAEDNPTNRLVVGKILNRWGANVCFAENGIEAKDMFAEDSNFDFILMDCEMPEMDGYSATRSIREFEQLKHRRPVPIIALTAHVLPEFRDKAHLAGMSEYITKPIDREELLQTILRLTTPDQLPRVGLS